MQETRYDEILNLIEEKGILRARDLDAHDIPREYLTRMVANGVIERIGRGLYALPNMEVTEHHTLTLASKRFPQGVVCLISALSFHGLTTQLPGRVWMAISPKDRLPRPQDVPMRFVRFSGGAFTEGAEVHEIENVAVPIYKPAKTVADCFKYRNKIGIDVAIEALRDCLAATDDDGRRLVGIDEIWHYAKICRVTNVMQPYLDVLA